jgi:hypothetical protein
MTRSVRVISSNRNVDPAEAVARLLERADIETLLYQTRKPIPRVAVPV